MLMDIFHKNRVSFLTEEFCAMNVSLQLRWQGLQGSKQCGCH